jgi:integrase
MRKGWTDLAVKQKLLGEHTDPLVVGLTLLVRPSASGSLRRSWVYRYTFAGKRQRLGLGAYPAVPLAAAQARAREAASQVAAGRNPIDARRAGPAPEAATFLDVVEPYLVKAAQRFRHDKSRAGLIHALHVHAKPFHSRPIVGIGPLDVAAFLNLLAEASPQRAESVRAALRGLFAYAELDLRTKGVALNNPTRPELLRAAGYASRPAGGHHPALANEELPAFIRALRTIHSSDALMLEFIILTVARYGAARHARFDQIDVHRKLWLVPSEQLKDARFRKEHFRVPLTLRTLEIVEEMRRRGSRASSSSFIFSTSSEPPSDMAVIKLLRRMCRVRPWVDPDTNHSVSTHGFRSTFRSWAQKTKQDRAAAEISMGHRHFGLVESRYTGDDLLDERRGLLTAWACHCAGVEANSVVALRSA